MWNWSQGVYEEWYIQDLINSGVVTPDEVFDIGMPGYKQIRTKGLMPGDDQDVEPLDFSQWENPNSRWDPNDWILKPDWMQHTGRTGDDRFRQNTMGGRGRYRGGVNPSKGHRSKPLDFAMGPSIWNVA